MGSGTSSTATFSIITSGTLGTPLVLTLGAPNLDFTLNTIGTTCTSVVTAGNTCSGVVNLAPKAPGQRLGAVEIVDTSNNILSTVYISAAGTDPLISFTPGTLSTIAGNGTGGYVAAQDGAPATAAELNPSSTLVAGQAMETP